MKRQKNLSAMQPVHARDLALRGRDVIVFSNDWDGDPLSKTHIMRILARENRILWVNSIGNRAPKLNGHDARRLVHKLSTFAAGIVEGPREVEKNLFVLSPISLPFFGFDAVRRANSQLLRLQILAAAKRLGMKDYLSWSYLPASSSVSGTLGEQMVVYQCVDEFSAFSDANGKHIADMEDQLLRKADLVVTSAARLFDSKIKVNKNTVLVRHGVDFNHFVKACDPDTVIPADIASLPTPVIGFFGLFADWVDQDVLKACARAHPEGSLVIIGKVAQGVNVTELKSLPNVHFLGRKTYDELPGYCRAFDVSLMPFVVNELTLNSNPLKVREYLAAGLPCVSTDIPEVRKVGLCKIAADTEDFVRKVDECLAEGAGPDRARAQKIFHESWDARVDEIRGHVGDTEQRILPLSKTKRDEAGKNAPRLNPQPLPL